VIFGRKETEKCLAELVCGGDLWVRHAPRSLEVSRSVVC
jgi:hypothetical protein